MGSIDQLNRSVSLESGAADFMRFVRGRIEQFRLNAMGVREEPLLQVATTRKAASSRLKAMCEIPPVAFDEYKERMTKAAVGIGSIDGSTWGSVLAPYQQASEAFWRRSRLIRRSIASSLTTDFIDCH